MMNLKPALAALFLITSAWSSSTQACSCQPPPAPKQAMEKSTAVFVGRVLSVEENRSYGYTVTFAVDRAWKGVDSKKAFVSTSRSLCGYRFEKDKEYIVYATGSDKLNLSTNLCDRTRPKVDSAEDLKELGEGKEPTEKPKAEEKEARVEKKD